jgi:uncharacterized protein YdhG (YjbR/CyaY superfamily)
VRGLCREQLPGFDEAMRHGMPSYLRDDAIGVAFAGQKASVTLYILRQAALAANAQRLTGLSVGKGAIRFRGHDQIDPNTARTATGDGRRRWSHLLTLLPGPLSRSSRRRA